MFILVTVASYSINGYRSTIESALHPIAKRPLLSKGSGGLNTIVKINVSHADILLYPIDIGTGLRMYRLVPRHSIEIWCDDIQQWSAVYCGDVSQDESIIIGQDSTLMLEGPVIPFWRIFDGGQLYFHIETKMTAHIVVYSNQSYDCYDLSQLCRDCWNIYGIPFDKYVGRKIKIYILITNHDKCPASLKLGYIRLTAQLPIYIQNSRRIEYRQ